MLWYYVGLRWPRSFGGLALALGGFTQPQKLECAMLSLKFQPGTKERLKQKMIREHGCNPDIYLACTHPVFSGPAIERLSNAGFKEVVVTNSIPLPPERHFPGLKVLSTAPLLAEVMIRNHTHQSISALYDI